MTDGQPDPQPAPAPGGGESKTLDDRMGAVEMEQREQRGILNRIEGLLTGNPKAPAASAPVSTPDGEPGGLSVAEQVKRGVAEIEAKRKKDADKKKADDDEAAWKASVDKRLAERKPAEPQTGRKVKLQERLFGKADAR